MSSCPCGSGQSFATCCQVYLDGLMAPTAEALMRSRYSAYTLGNLDHIQRTGTERANRAFDRAAIEATLPVTEWLGLSVLRTEGGKALDTSGIVEFEFRYRENGREHVQQDISSFVRVDDVWLYDQSDVRTAPSRPTVTPVGRNDPCPCGSGRKYKKCHGAAA